MTVLSKQKKIIVDIPYTINKLPAKLVANTPGITKIRTSQYQVNPYKSRIVFDLKKSNITASLEKKENQFKINFKTTKKKISRRPSPHKKSVSHRTQTIKKSHYSKTSPLKGKIIIVDAGHGGKDPGAISLNKYQEKFFTLDIAKRVQKKLANQGAVVIMTRRNDRYISLQSRAYRANKNNADIFISIHVNSFLKSSVHGTESFYYKYKDRSLATHIQKQLVKDLKSKDLKIKRARLYVLRHTKMPATLIEPLFITNPRERKKVQSPKYRQRIANSIYQGVHNYFKYQ
jgi:N-acetylmuramoyl-L-alanine amidase